MNIQNQILMSYNKFRSNVIEHLAASYNKWGAGFFKGKKYSHIANVEGRDKKDIVKQILKEDGVESDLLDPKKIHKCAHHLNSSQIVCYEFFRPLKTNVCKRDKVLGKMNIPSASFAKVDIYEFERVSDLGDGTTFDFSLSSNKNCNLRVEVKYTEQGFATCKDDDTHKQKFNDIYKKLIKNSFCIKDYKKGDIEFPEMRKYYQLFRNVLDIKNPTDYVVFLFPRENSIAKYQFEDFRDNYLSEEGHEHVKGVYWEDLAEFMSENFRNKFFFYL